MKARKKKRKTRKKSASNHSQTKVHLDSAIVAQARMLAASNGLDAAISFLQKSETASGVSDYLTALAHQLQNTDPSLSLESARKAVTLAPEGELRDRLILDISPAFR
ncbi:hypothetical protein [Desulfonatronospira thiodismutans]|uniref:hypothetical protein n=1 Tax=Desulfonatronospira thiodismutans TaxID=488939 RepID=UPI00118635EA|nr:hypothetical protein [Desulfonatronospira thiodismutans]